MISKHLLPSRKEKSRRIYAYQGNKVAVYGSPKRDAAGGLTYKVEFIEPLLGEDKVYVENRNHRERIPNNLKTKDLVARLAFTTLNQKSKTNYSQRQAGEIFKSLTI